jgi:hypothetical protein
MKRPRVPLCGSCHREGPVRREGSDKPWTRRYAPFPLLAADVPDSVPGNGGRLPRCAA